MKICKMCLEELPLTSFSTSKQTKDGYEGKCRVCRNSQRKKISKICDYCKSEFKSNKKDSRFCSSQCAGAFRLERIIHNCDECNDAFETVPSRIKKDKNLFCSKECWTKNLSKSMSGELNRNYKRAITNCHKCKKEMNVHLSRKNKNKYLFCSKECYVSGIGSTRIGELNGNFFRIDCTCVECNIVFKRKPSQIRGETYCSNECRLKALRRGEFSKQAPKKSVRCFNCSKDIIRLESNLAKVSAYYCSISCKDIRFAKTFRSGENAYNYNPNKTLEERMRDRNYSEYRIWRTRVYNRDNYTCVVCDNDKGGNLIAHHLFSYARNPTLRTELNNGVTLCRKCHSDFHNHYGYYNNTEDQFYEFKKSKIS
jgi:5-methylcytosine-specific restriction endonuclease McrA